MNNYIKYWPFVAMIVTGIIGFFIGRANQKEVAKTKTEYIKGDTIVDSIPYPVPYETIVFEKPDLPKKRDSLKIYVPGKDSIIYVSEKVDTSAIINQFAVENKYRHTLFDNDTSGKLIVNTAVQYNQQKSIGYTYTPVYRVVTKTVHKKNTVRPFAAISYNTLQYGGIGGGVFIKKVGFEYKYLNNFKNQTAHEGGLKFEF